MKYIFVTGGVVSGLGKGITAASLGRLLKQRGFKVTAQKLDPYMNVDPGTMSPLEHGEVFVTDDGAETDLDLGHYERFIDESLNKYSNLTSGKVYYNVLSKERTGGFLGQTVQVIPHITNEIKDFIYKSAKHSSSDILITEIGGTIGDIESGPFLESIRQISHEVGLNNCLFIHVTLVPYLKASKEHKSKPTQHSVKELRSIGITPNIIITRSDEPIDNSIKDKIALFCNVPRDCVIENETVDYLYEAPLMLHENQLDTVVMRELSLEDRPIDLSEWTNLVERLKAPTREVEVAIVGKYISLEDAYLSVVESVKHACLNNSVKPRFRWIDSETVTPENSHELLGGLDAIIVPGGFGSRGIEGKIATAKFARENNIPFLGICLGMQITVIEFARNVCGITDANSSEFSQNCPNPVIDIMEDQVDVTNKGGTMRLGSYDCKVLQGSLLHKVYDADIIAERHRHRYEFNNNYKEILEKNGLVISGVSPTLGLAEAVEYPKNKYYIAAQYHPEFKSRPNKPHPLFNGLIEACL